MRALVTGGAGFIGSHFVDDLVEHEHQVLVVDNLCTGKAVNVHNRADLEVLDITDPALDQLVECYRPDVVYHFAAQIDVRVSLERPVFDASQNILGSLRLLEAARKSGTRHVFFASSGGAIYGEPTTVDGPDESESPNPLSPYGVAKLSVEKYLHFYSYQYQLPFTAFRFSNVYGPRQNYLGEAGVVALFISRLLTKQECIIFGDGLQTRDFVFVKDLVMAARMLLRNPLTGVFNLGTGIETTVNELFECISRRIPGSRKPLHGNPRPGEQRRSVLNCERARNELGWQPLYSLGQGLDQTLEWFSSPKTVG